ncbi:MAG: beta-ketoacyl-[acyl-carrier-protein] synthase family protein [Desulfobacterales bacterium]|nr:beta-ketoacyl-[acyl-carrier-protein] synthase family protein [Desulfobacterales bacterium]
MNVVITGIGGISAAGANLVEILDTFQSGRRNGGSVSLFPTVLTYPVFEVRNIARKWHREGMRTLSLALCAVEEALGDAGLQDDLSGLRVGICLGTTVASQLNDLEFYRTYRSAGTAAIDAVDRFLKGNLAEAVARTIKVRGPAATVVNACSSGADAIGVALSWLRNGVCDIALAGGADELNLVPLCGFGSLGIVSDSLCSPFDRDRRGLNLGEGAGVVILETEAVSRERGIERVLYLSGYGSAADAYHLTAPRPDGTGLEAALRKALAEANITPRDVCFVNAHGTATRDNDKVEGTVLAGVFGPGIKFFSTKGFTGHTLGAAGALEAVFTAAALRKGWIPASIGFVHQDDEISVSPVTEKTRIHGRFAVSTSLAFGGNNAALVIACAENGGS